jgi:hypothetical protein
MLPGEKIEGNGFTHRFVSGREGMQVIAAIISRRHLTRMLRIAQHVVEVNHCIEVSCRTNPLIHGLSVALAQRPWVVVVGTDIRCDRGAKDT